MSKEGFVLLQFAPAVAARQYDWNRKQVDILLFSSCLVFCEFLLCFMFVKCLLSSLFVFFTLGVLIVSHRSGDFSGAWREGFMRILPRPFQREKVRFTLEPC